MRYGADGEGANSGKNERMMSLKDFRAELGKGQVGVVRKTVHGDSPV